ncbi:MAG: AarF/UbiB family protein, partial [Coriobacteriales bacterium]
MPNFNDIMKRFQKRGSTKGSTKRAVEILGILRKHDAGKGLTPEKAVAILEDLGPTFVKLGQVASTHPDIIPPEYCREFAKLRADVNPMPYEMVASQIEDNLGKPIDVLFSDFDENALGSASVAQV